METRKPPHVRGGTHGKFAGGVKVNSDGYLQITAGPLRGVYVHRVVMEAKLGRELEIDEEVHHLDGDRLNPSPDNLEVRAVEGHRAFLNGRPEWWRKG